MKTICKTEGTHTYFIISDADTAYLDTIRDLEYKQVEDGFAKAFPAESPYIEAHQS